MEQIGTLSKMIQKSDILFIIIEQFRLMKIVIVLCLLVYFAQGDYFAQLPLNKILTDRANEAINTFLGTLNFYLDCSLDPEPRSTRKNGRQKYNNIGNFATRWRSQFKRSRDRQDVIFTYPLSRNKRGGKNNKKVDLYNKLRDVAWYLQQIKAELIRYNNIIVGSGNSVKGNGNFVIGSNNTLQGNNFWVFDSGINRQGIEDGVLIIQNYLIEMADMNYILKNPRKVVRCVDKNERERQVFRWRNKAARHLKLEV